MPGFTKYKTNEDIFRTPPVGAETTLFNMAYNVFALKKTKSYGQLSQEELAIGLKHLTIGMLYFHYLIILL